MHPVLLEENRCTQILTSLALRQLFMIAMGKSRGLTAQEGRSDLAGASTHPSSMSLWEDREEEIT
jgi:hypothetical protein